MEWLPTSARRWRRDIEPKLETFLKTLANVPAYSPPGKTGDVPLLEARACEVILEQARHARDEVPRLAAAAAERLGVLVAQLEERLARLRQIPDADPPVPPAAGDVYLFVDDVPAASLVTFSTPNGGWVAAAAAGWPAGHPWAAFVAAENLAADLSAHEGRTVLVLGEAAYDPAGGWLARPFYRKADVAALNRAWGRAARERREQKLQDARRQYGLG